MISAMKKTSPRPIWATARQASGGLAHPNPWNFKPWKHPKKSIVVAIQPFMFK